MDCRFMELRTKHLTRNSFLLSLLLHALFLLLLISVVVFQPEEKHKIPPDMYTPSYVYKGSISPSMAKASKPTTSHSQETPKKSETTEPRAQSTSRQALFPKQHKSIMEMSRDVIRADQMQSTMSTFENLEPILLIGDKNQPPDPFLKELGRCLSANLHYPKLEGELGTRGRVLISFVLHPDGTFSNVQVVRSSDNPHFDNAALYATNQAPSVRGADRFLSKAKYFVVGFIFD